MTSPRITHGHPNNEFIGACHEFDDLMVKLNALRSNHFNVSPNDPRNWGDVGSLAHINGCLREALAHYNVAA